MTDNMVNRLREWASLTNFHEDREVLNGAADEIERLREALSRWKVEQCVCGCHRSPASAAADEIELLGAALALAAGMISTLPQYENQHPQMVMEMLLEEARRGLVSKSDRVRNSVRAECHARPVAVWQSHGVGGVL